MDLLRQPLALSAAAILFLAPGLLAQNQEKTIVEKLHRLRSLPDDERSEDTRRLAMAIRQLPASGRKVALAQDLASLATEGDAGHATLQEVATTLAQGLNERTGDQGQSAEPYETLAQLVRYEHVNASVDNPQFAAAMTKLEADERAREGVDFTLVDLKGKKWTLSDLRGRVVLVNFWATWCPPCRKEMPDLEALQQRFGPKRLVILAITDEEPAKVQPFVAERKLSFPILLDPGAKVRERMRVVGIPKSFVYESSGKIVAQAIDGRTSRQFLELLKQADLQ
jgi:thiol-disulfide isomerase/thioredoxin